MGTGAITSYVDVAQLVLYAFWAFFAGLVYYLIRENHRDGFPLDAERGRIDGWPFVKEAKGYALEDGSVAYPYGKPTPMPADAQPLHRTAGGPIVPTGNPLTAGVGPVAWNARADVVDRDHHGDPKILPLRNAPALAVSDKDPDPRGMAVTAADGNVAGTVKDLWIDAPEMLFRYLEVDVGGRTVLVPMTFAKVGWNGVKVEALLAEQFAGVPPTKAPDQITRLEEEKITAYFGAGLLYAEPSRQEPLL